MGNGIKLWGNVFENMLMYNEVIVFDVGMNKLKFD